MPVSQSWGCSRCEQTFPSHQQLLDHVKNHPTVTITKAADVVTSTVFKAEAVVKTPTPIELTYVFKGMCPTCANSVSTLEIDIEDKHFCIAVCSRCQKQCRTKEVAKL